jgi:hypothetical protein
MSGGFFQIPLLATLQHADTGRKLGDVIAYLNLGDFYFCAFRYGNILGQHDAE